MQTGDCWVAELQAAPSKHERALAHVPWQDRIHQDAGPNRLHLTPDVASRSQTGVGMLREDPGLPAVVVCRTRPVTRTPRPLAPDVWLEFGVGHDRAVPVTRRTVAAPVLDAVFGFRVGHSARTWRHERSLVQVQLGSPALKAPRNEGAFIVSRQFHGVAALRQAHTTLHSLARVAASGGPWLFHLVASIKSSILSRSWAQKIVRFCS